MNVRRSIKIDSKQVREGLQIFSEETLNLVEKHLKNEAEELEKFMKENAPWNDRTGNARRGLVAKVEKPKNKYYRIGLKHSVKYGVYLENYMERRFAILEPTVRLKGPEVILKMKNLLNKL